MSQNYNVFPIDLSVAGSRVLSIFSGVLRLVRAVDATGGINLDAEVEVRLGDNEGDWIPLAYGNAAFGYDTELTIRWNAQPGVIGYFFRSADPKTADVDARPAAQLIVGSLASAAAPSAVVVGLAAVQIAAAKGSRKSITIQNLGSDIFFGNDATVTVANGLKIPAGASYSTELYAGAFWAISAVAGQDVRVWEEG